MTRFRDNKPCNSTFIAGDSRIACDGLFLSLGSLKNGVLMSPQFDRFIDRTGTNSLKWDYRKEIFGREDILPMWVADADWPTAPPVVNAIVKRAEHAVSATQNRAKRPIVWLLTGLKLDTDGMLSRIG